MTLTYDELVRIPTFEERIEYLRMGGLIGEQTFGFNRYINQAFYKSREWRDIRNQVIIRDNGCDLAMPGYEIPDKILIHHLNPITEEDIEDRNPCVFDLNGLVCVSFETHNYIHFGYKNPPRQLPVERHIGDIKLW